MCDSFHTKARYMFQSISFTFYLLGRHFYPKRFMFWELKIIWCLEQLKVKGFPWGSNGDITLLSIRFEQVTFRSLAQRPNSLSHTPPQASEYESRASKTLQWRSPASWCLQGLSMYSCGDQADESHGAGTWRIEIGGQSGLQGGAALHCIVSMGEGGGIPLKAKMTIFQEASVWGEKCHLLARGSQTRGFHRLADRARTGQYVKWDDSKGVFLGRRTSQ